MHWCFLLGEGQLPFPHYKRMFSPAPGELSAPINLNSAARGYSRFAAAE